MRNWKKVAIAIAVAGLMIGCSSSIDKQKLADLTAGKTFKQVEQAYAMSVYNGNPDQKVYAYWLQENGKKADPTFNFDLLQMKVTKAKKKIDEEVDKKIKALPGLTFNELKMLKTQAAFMSLTLKPYKKFFDAIEKEIHKRLK